MILIELDDARTRNILAKQNYDKLKRCLRPEEIDSARARREQAVAQVKAINGMITHKAVEEGEIFMPYSSLFRISCLDIDAEPKKAFLNKDIYISSIAEFTPKNVQTKEDWTKFVFGLKIEIPNPEHTLKPGMPADAVIEAKVDK